MLLSTNAAAVAAIVCAAISLQGASAAPLPVTSQLNDDLAVRTLFSTATSPHNLNTITTRDLSLASEPALYPRGLREKARGKLGKAQSKIQRAKDRVFRFPGDTTSQPRTDANSANANALPSTTDVNGSLASSDGDGDLERRSQRRRKTYGKTQAARPRSNRSRGTQRANQNPRRRKTSNNIPGPNLERNRRRRAKRKAAKALHQQAASSATPQSLTPPSGVDTPQSPMTPTSPTADPSTTVPGSAAAGAPKGGLATTFSSILKKGLENPNTMKQAAGLLGGLMGGGSSQPTDSGPSPTTGEHPAASETGDMGGQEA